MSKYFPPKQDYGTTPSEPAAELIKVRQPSNWQGTLNTLLIIGVLIYVVMREPSAPLPPGPGPEPTPIVVITEDVEKITAEAEKKWLKYKAEASERLAADIEAKKITSSGQFAKIASEYQDAIEREANAGLIELNQKYLRESGKDGWTAEQLRAIKELQLRKAKGYRSLVK